MISSRESRSPILAATIRRDGRTSSEGGNRKPLCLEIFYTPSPPLADLAMSLPVPSHRPGSHELAAASVGPGAR